MNGLRDWKRKLVILLCAILCVLCFGVSIGLTMFKTEGKSVPNAYAATPYYQYAEISSVKFRAGQSEHIYRGITTAAGLKSKLEVKARHGSGERTLAGEEYNIYRVDGAEKTLLSPTDVVVTDDRTDVSVVIASGTVEREFYIETIKDAVYLTDEPTITISGTLTDDYTNENISEILTVKNGEEVLDRDLYTPNIEYEYATVSGNLSVSAKLTVTYRTSESATATVTVPTPDVRFAQIQGAAVSVKSLYTLASDGTYRDSNNFSVFNVGMTRKEVLGKLDVYAVYPHSFKKLDLEFNGEGGTLSGTTSHEGISVTPDQYNSATAQIIVTLTDRINETRQVVAPMLSLNFTERTIAKIEVDQNKVDTALSSKNIYPYTNVKTELLDVLKPTIANVNGQEVVQAGAVTLYYSNGDMARPDDRVWNDISFDVLTPTAEDIVAAKDYDKTISVAYDRLQETLKVKGIQYSAPEVDNKLTSPTGIASQTMHQPFDFTGITINFYYNVGFGYDINAPLSDFFDKTNLTQSAKFIKLTLYKTDGTPLTAFDQDHPDIANTIITKDTDRAVIEFSYDGTTWTRKYTAPFTPVKEGIAPTFDRSTISFSEDCYKELKNGQELMSEIPEVQVSVLTNQANAVSDKKIPAGTFESSAYDESTGKITFKSGGWFYIRLDITAKTDEYEFLETSDNEITRTATKYVIPVFIAKGEFVLTTEYRNTFWQYGDTENKLPTVKGTLGSATQVLPFGDDQEVPVRLAYFRITDAATNFVDWSGYNELTYENALSRGKYLTVGKYRVVAVTKETLAYSASKTRQSAASTIEVKQKEISASDLNRTLSYDRTAHQVIDDAVLSSKLVYGDKPSDIFEITSGDSAYTYVGAYKPTLGFKEEKPNYKWASGFNGVISFQITKKTFSGFTFTLDATTKYYGEVLAPTAQSQNKGNGEGTYYTTAAAAYYPATASDPSVLNTKPSGSPQTDAFREWSVGYYYVYYGTEAKLTDAEKAAGRTAGQDFELPCYAVKFEIKPAEIAPIRLNNSDDIAADLGAYDGTDKEITLTNWLAKVVNGNKTLDASNYLNVKLEYTPKVGAVQTVNSATVADGVLKYKNAGTYKLTISITDENVQWTTADGDGSQNYEITFTVSIDRATIGQTPVTENKGLIYNGADQEIAIAFSGSGTWDSLNLSDKATYTVKGTAGQANASYSLATNATNSTGKFNAKNAGTYLVTVVLTDKNNYEWLSGDVSDYTVEYAVAQAEISVNWDGNSFRFQDGAAQQTTPVLTSVSPLYNSELLIANLKTVVYIDAECTHIVNEGTAKAGKVTAAGDYYIKVTDFTVSGGEKGNYVLNYEKAGANLVYPFTIEQLAIEKPTAGTVTVEFDGSTFDFYAVATNAENGLTLPSKWQLTITATEVGGKTTMRDAATYTVTVSPAGDYKWNDNTTTGIVFTFVITPKDAEFAWNVGVYTYDGATTYAPTIIQLNGLVSGDSVTWTITGGSQNAGNYQAKGTLEGTHADNYNVTNRTQAFIVKKAVLGDPDMTKTAAFTRKDQAFTVAGWDAIKNKVTVTSSAKNIADKDPSDWTFTDGTLTLLHAGVYQLTFTINDGYKDNYCWNVSEQTTFDASAPLIQKVTVNRAQLTAPVLGESRALEIDRGKPLDGVTDKTVAGIPYEVVYGTYDYNTDIYTVGDFAAVRAKTFFVRVSVVRDGEKVSGTSYSIYDFEWVENTTDLTYRNYLTGVGGYGKAQDNGLAFNLHYIYTMAKVGANFTLFGDAATYVFGDNVTGGKYQLEASVPVTSLGTGTYAWFTYEEDPNFVGTLDGVKQGNVSVKFYTDEACKNEVGTLINGLPWNAAEKYYAVISVTFSDESDLEPFTRTVEFTVDRFTITTDMVEWDEEVSHQYDRTGHMRTAEVKADMLPKSGAAELDAVVPSLTVKAWLNNQWTDQVTNVLYSGDSVAAYSVYVTAAEGNYRVGERTIGQTYQIVPAEITALAGVDAEKIYGDQLGDYTFTHTGIISGDEGVISVDILDGEGNRVTAGSPVSGGGEYYVVPRLKTRAENPLAGNYTLATTTVVEKGDFTITARTITLTIDGGHSAVFGESFDLNRTDNDRIYTIGGKRLYSDDVATDVFTLKIGENTNTQGLAQGSYTVTYTSSNGNYTISSFNNTNQFTIWKATITIDTVTAYGDTYDGTFHDVLKTHKAIFAVENVINEQWWISDAATRPDVNSDAGWTLYTQNNRDIQVKDAGAYSYWVRVTANNHEPKVYETKITVNIAKAELTVQAHFSIYYNEEKPENYGYLSGDETVLINNAATDNSKAYEISGLKGADTVSNLAELNGTFSYKTNYEQGKDVGAYAITLTLNLTSKNYTFKAASENGLTVLKLPITVNTHSRTGDTYSENVSFNAWETWLNTEGSGFEVVLQDSHYQGKGKIHIPTGVTYADLFEISSSAVLSSGRTNDVGTYQVIMTKTQNDDLHKNYEIKAGTVGTVQIVAAGKNTISGFSVSGWQYGATSVTPVNPKVLYKWGEGGVSADEQTLKAELFFKKAGAGDYSATPKATYKLTVSGEYGNGWSYDVSSIFGDLSEFGAGDYKLVFTSAGNKNYTEGSLECTFTVQKAQLTYATEDVTVGYGTGFNASYSFTPSGYVYNQTASALKLSIGSRTDYNTDNRFAGEYYICATVSVDGRSLTVETENDTTFENEFDNYVVTFRLARLTVTPRALTITIDNHTNIYHYLAIENDRYVAEEKQTVTYLLGSGEFYDKDELNFKVKTKAYSGTGEAQQTNNAGRYPIYATFASEDLLKSYSVTIVTTNGGYGANYQGTTDEHVVRNVGTGYNAALFTITKAKILLNDVKPFYWEGGQKVFYDPLSLESMTYDGRNKNYEPTLAGPNGESLTDVKIVVEYFVNGMSLEDKAPKDVGNYEVRFTFAEHPNYEPAESSETFPIYKRQLSLDSLQFDWTYTGNAREYTVTFKNLVSGELLEDFTVSTVDPETWKIEKAANNDTWNVFTFTATDAGVYAFAIGFTDVQNYSVIGNKVDVSFTIAKRTLTVKADDTSIQYGTPVSETNTGRFAGYSATYKLNPTEGSLSDDTLIEREINSYTLKPQASVVFKSSYTPSAHAGADFAINVSGVSDTKNFKIVFDHSGKLTVNKRQVKVRVNGYSDGNISAASDYNGLTTHNVILSGAEGTFGGLLYDYITAFLSPVGSDTFGNEFASGVSLADKLRALRVRLTVDASSKDVREAGYAMRPSSDSSNYEITFVGRKKGDDVRINDIQVSGADALDYLPNYYIKPLNLQVKVVRNVENPVFADTRFDVTYGDTANFTVQKGGDGYYTLMYSGWLNSGEGGSFSIGTAANNNGRITACSIAGHYKNGNSNGRTSYIPWESIAGDYYTITPVTDAISFTNYTLSAIPVNMHVKSRAITSATAASKAYTEDVVDGNINYHGGAYGATLNAEIEFGNVGTNSFAKVEHAEFTYLGTRGGKVPNRADIYDVTVNLSANANGEYNYVFGAGVTGRVSDTRAVIEYQITKQIVTLVCADDRNAFILNTSDKTNALTNFVKDIMQSPSFTRSGYDVTFDYEDGLPFLPDAIGTYYVVVAFNDDAETNYAWANNQSQGTIQFTVVQDGDAIVSIINLKISGWVFGQDANSAEFDIYPTGVQAERNSAYAYLGQRSGLTAGGVSAADVTGKYQLQDSDFNAVPFHSGWYMLRASAVGANNTAQAYYLFYIEKAQVDAPTLNVGKENNNYRYTGHQLVVNATFPTIVLINSYSGSWEGAEDNARLFAVGQGTYQATFSLSNTSNYQWNENVVTKNLVTIDGNVHLRLVRNGDTLVYYWTVRPAADNTVRWTNGRDTLEVIYGDPFSFSANAHYPSASIVYEYAPRTESDTQAPAAGDESWTANKPHYGGLYWVRARAYSVDGNFNESIVTLKLTIAKKALSLHVTGSLVYGQAFDEGRYTYEIVDTLTRNEQIRIYGAPAAYALANSALNWNRLNVDVYALTLASKTENGIEVVDGLSSDDFYFPVANVSGTLTVSKANLLVQIGNAASDYSETIDLTSAIDDLAIIGGTLAAWERDSSLNSLLDSTIVTDATATSNVGNYAIKCSGYDNGNYNVTFYNGIYRIDQLRIRIEIASGGGKYGDETIEGARVTGIFKEADDTAVEDENLTFGYIYTGVSNDGTWRFENGASTDVCPTLAGTYTATAVNPDNGNYLLVGTSSVPFVVAKMEIDANEITAPNQAYTGNALSPSIVDNAYNVDGKEIYSVQPVGNWVNAGTYEITLVMKDFANMKWLSVDVQERKIPFVIEKAKNALTSEIEISGWTYGQYDAEKNAPHATTKFGSPVFYYSTDENGEFTTGAPRNENAGEYFVRAYVQGTDNYEELKLTDGKAVSFRISPVVVGIPSLGIITDGEGKNDTYAAADLSAAIAGYDTSLMNIAYDGNLSVSGNGVEIFARNAGSYTVRITFIDPVNYVWAAGDEAADGVVTLGWTIAKRQLAKPTANDSLFIVTGKVLEYIPVGFDAETMNISGNLQGFGGSFIVEVSLKDLSNYEWIGGTDEKLEFTWTIVGVNTVFTVIVGSLSGGCAVAAAVAVTQGVLLRKRRLADEKAATGNAQKGDGSGGDGSNKEQPQPEQQETSKNELKEEEKSND